MAIRAARRTLSTVFVVWTVVVVVGACDFLLNRGGCIDGEVRQPGHLKSGESHE